MTVEQAIAALAARPVTPAQIPLDADIAKIIEANKWDLYSSAEHASAPDALTPEQIESFMNHRGRLASAPEALSIPARIAELIDQHGSLRAAARVLECDPGYLSRLQSGEKDDPGALLLRRMGLHQITTYERTQP